MVIADVPYIKTDYWWDNEAQFNKGTIRNAFSGLKRFTSGSSVCKIYSAHQQVNPIKKRLTTEANMKVGKNPYFWIYPIHFYKVFFFKFYILVH